MMFDYSLAGLVSLGLLFYLTYALLRPAGLTAPDVPTVRIKVAKSADGASLPGYTFTQEGAF